MFAFHFDAETGRYLGSTPIEFDQREPGRKLIPAFATDRPPPTVQKDQTAYYKLGEWVVQCDSP